MEILSYLSELIQTRKSVGIHGLGTVYKKKLPGRYDAATHSFIPPSYTLDFTAEIKEDILLSDFICKQRNVSADTANYFINEFSAGILKQLNEHQEASLGELGKLSKVNDELKFVPAETINYGFDFFGLPSIKAEQEPVAEEIIPETPDVEESEEKIAEEKLIAEQESKDTEEVQEEPVKDTPVIPVVVQEPEVITPAAIETPEQLHEEEPAITADKPAVTEDHNAQDDEEHEIIPGVYEPYRKKDEQQLRAEIEALNYYRSHTPAEHTPAPEREEVIWNIKDNTPAVTVQPDANENSNDFYPEEEAKGSPLYLKIILGLLILAIVLTIAFFTKPEWFNRLTGNTSVVPQKTVQPVTPSAPAAVTDTLTDSSAKAKDTIKKAPAVTKPAAKDSVATAGTVPVKQTDSVVVYEIIGASMHDQKEADKFIALMKKSGINAKVVTNMAGRRLKMSIATLKDRESAEIELKKLSEKLKIPGIYIYRNKQQ